MKVQPPNRDSFERQCRDARSLRLRPDPREGRHDAPRKEPSGPRLERLIGMVYRPDTEPMKDMSQLRCPKPFEAGIPF